MDKSSDTKGLKGIKDRKQSALKRKSEYTLDDNSRPTSSNEKAKRNKRSTRACERCRNKKIKCDPGDGNACVACKDADALCEAGNGNHAENKKYPPGYTESIEHTSQAQVLVIQKLFQMVKNGEPWHFEEPGRKEDGKVIIHDIARILDCLRKAPGLPKEFVEDSPALYHQLMIEEEQSKMEEEPRAELTKSFDADSKHSELESPKFSPGLKVESPVEFPLSYYDPSQSRQSSGMRYLSSPGLDVESSVASSPSSYYDSRQSHQSSAMEYLASPEFQSELPFESAPLKNIDHGPRQPRGSSELRSIHSDRRTKSRPTAMRHSTHPLGFPNRSSNHMSQYSSDNMPYGTMTNGLNFPHGYSPVMNNRQPDLMTQLESSHHPEQSTLSHRQERPTSSSSTQSSHSFTHDTSSRFQSHGSLIRPLQGTSNQVNSSSTRPPSLATSHDDSLYTPDASDDDFPLTPLWGQNTFPFRQQAMGFGDTSLPQWKTQSSAPQPPYQKPQVSSQHSSLPHDPSTPNFNYDESGDMFAQYMNIDQL